MHQQEALRELLDRVMSQVPLLLTTLWYLGTNPHWISTRYTDRSLHIVTMPFGVLCSFDSVYHVLTLTLDEPHP